MAITFFASWSPWQLNLLLFYESHFLTTSNRGQGAQSNTSIYLFCTPLAPGCRGTRLWCCYARRHHHSILNFDPIQWLCISGYSCGDTYVWGTIFSISANPWIPLPGGMNETRGVCYCYVCSSSSSGLILCFISRTTVTSLNASKNKCCKMLP